MIRHFCSAAASGVIFLLAASMAQAQAPAQKPAPKNECFFVSQFENWKPGGDEKTMYIRVGMNRFYRLDLANRCQEMSWPNPIMVNKFHGTSICSPLDWNIRISSGPGTPAVPCIVKAMTRLSPAEVSALPKKQKP